MEDIRLLGPQYLAPAVGDSVIDDGDRVGHIECNWVTPRAPRKTGGLQGGDFVTPRLQCNGTTVAAKQSSTRNDYDLERIVIRLKRDSISCIMLTDSTALCPESADGALKTTSETTLSRR